ncbi:MAG: hypothetical protein K2R93_01805 [Gemmatimonadaceae bacterium]|nr:hypothetical protein [Gemmatimonadaceae bacterium]
MPNPRVPLYDLEAPTLALIVTSLSRYVDEDEVPALLTAARAEAGLEPEHPETPEVLLRLVEGLERQGDFAATCAKGLRVRIKSYLVLAAAHRSP